MGVIDKTTYKLRCAACDVTEVKSVLDRGSMWSGSHWESGPAFEHFRTSWEGSGSSEPELKASSCQTCGASATVNRS